MNKWDIRFLQLAHHISTWSKDPSSQVGAVITDAENRIVSTGYNGFPRRTSDAGELYDNRTRKYRRVIHAEKNAIMFANSNLSGCTLYVTFFPCTQCAAALIQCGITKLATIKPSEDYMSRWSEDVAEAKQMLKEARIVYVEYEPEILEDIIICHKEY